MRIRQPAVVLAFALFALTLFFVVYRIVWLQYPVLPTIPGQVWRVSFEALVKAEEQKIAVSVGLPSEQAGSVLMEERITSDTLNFNLFQEGVSRIGHWSGTSEGYALITYKNSLLLRPRRFPPSASPAPAVNLPPITREEAVYTEHFSTRWKTFNALQRFKAVVSVSGGEGEEIELSKQDRDAWRELEEKYGRTDGLLILFRAAGQPARIVSGLLLEKGIQTLPITWLEVWDGKQWQHLNPWTGRLYTSTLLALAPAGRPVVQTTKGQVVNTSWSLEREIMDKWRLHFERIRKSARLLDRWSFFSIPEEFQNIFRILLLVPLGALMICVLRNVLGFPTFGIFMPVLLALAFRNTGLFYGIAIFASVILIGYTARSGIDRFHLLLVPRLSVLLTLVIICFGLFALIGGKLNIQSLMGVGLLPIVILTMSIERFFILIEESGAHEALRTASGTIAVALITYFVIQWEPLQLTFFVYPELLFAVAGAEILLGRYTGYRVSEVIRFKALTRKGR